MTDTFVGRDCSYSTCTLGTPPAAIDHAYTRSQPDDDDVTRTSAVESPFVTTIWSFVTVPIVGSIWMAVSRSASIGSPRSLTRPTTSFDVHRPPRSGTL